MTHSTTAVKKNPRDGMQSIKRERRTPRSGRDTLARKVRTAVAWPSPYPTPQKESPCPAWGDDVLAEGERR